MPYSGITVPWLASQNSTIQPDRNSTFMECHLLGKHPCHGCIHSIRGKEGWYSTPPWVAQEGVLQFMCIISNCPWRRCHWLRRRKHDWRDWAKWWRNFDSPFLLDWFSRMVGSYKHIHSGSTKTLFVSHHVFIYTPGSHHLPDLGSSHLCNWILRSFNLIGSSEEHHPVASRSLPTSATKMEITHFTARNKDVHHHDQDLDYCSRLCSYELLLFHHHHHQKGLLDQHWHWRWSALPAYHQQQFVLTLPVSLVPLQPWQLYVPLFHGLRDPQRMMCLTWEKVHQ